MIIDKRNNGCHRNILSLSAGQERFVDLLDDESMKPTIVKFNGDENVPSRHQIIGHLYLHSSIGLHHGYAEGYCTYNKRGGFWR